MVHINSPHKIPGLPNFIHSTDEGIHASNRNTLATLVVTCNAKLVLRLIMLRRFKLQGQNLPKRACLHHSGKIVVSGTRKQRDIKSSEKLITWNIWICF